jgi:hypothetical protein
MAGAISPGNRHSERKATDQDLVLRSDFVRKVQCHYIVFYVQVKLVSTVRALHINFISATPDSHIEFVS